MSYKRAPLYRKENKVSLSDKYHVCTGSEFRHQRHTKRFLNNDYWHTPMHSGKYGYDYTPLFRFLLSKVGKNWDNVYAEAKSRLDKAEPIFWLVALYENAKKKVVRIGEATYYSGLFVDENGLLQKVDPEATLAASYCTCCTHSFNGEAIFN